MNLIFKFTSKILSLVQPNCYLPPVKGGDSALCNLCIFHSDLLEGLGCFNPLLFKTPVFFFSKGDFLANLFIRTKSVSLWQLCRNIP